MAWNWFSAHFLLCRVGLTLMNSSRWWQLKYFSISPLLDWNVIQFDLRIFFKWVVQPNHQPVMKLIQTLWGFLLSPLKKNWEKDKPCADFSDRLKPNHQAVFFFRGFPTNVTMTDLRWKLPISATSWSKVLGGGDFSDPRGQLKRFFGRSKMGGPILRHQSCTCFFFGIFENYLLVWKKHDAFVWVDVIWEWSL